MNLLLFTVVFRRTLSLVFKSCRHSAISPELRALEQVSCTITSTTFSISGKELGIVRTHAFALHAATVRCSTCHTRRPPVAPVASSPVASARLLCGAISNFNSELLLIFTI